jgi:hypothetical protein
MKYTDGSDSREVEEHDDWDVSDDEDMKKFKEGFAYKKPVSILDIRDKLVNIIELAEVARIALLAGKEHEIVKVSNVLFFSVITPLEQIEKELALL